MSAFHSRKREKPVLSCLFCRGRKLRCDRQSPCSVCAKRGKSAECVYTCSEQERKEAIDYRPHTRQARQRAARLEKLVTQMRDEMGVNKQSSKFGSGCTTLLNQPADDFLPTIAPHDGYVADSVGRLSLSEDNAVTYVGSTHWGTILEEIQKLKDNLSDDLTDATRTRESTVFDDDSIAGSPVTRVSLLSCYPSLPREQILATLPPRKVVDRHVSHFFNNFDFAASILHRDKFLSEYSKFWENPSTAPIMWVGLLFSVMSISAFLNQQDVRVESQEILQTYRTLTINCLIAGNYLQPSRYTIETLTLHFAVDQNMNPDASINNWTLIGVIIRLALRTGLHRDPSHWPNIRPLEAEFRRRLWITLYHMDFFTSTQVGLPRIVKDSQCDVRPPANLIDDDLSFEHDEMPIARPLTEYTPLSHIIQRHTIIRVTAEIYDATEAGPPSTATIAALDAKLAKAINSIPEKSKYPALETAIADNPVTILHRIFIDILIHKAVYLLHRRTFMKGFEEQETTMSGELCMSAALAILDHQRRIAEESEPGGIMFGIRWRVASSLNHEFLQATMMLCFALNKLQGHTAFPRRDEILSALKTAKPLWEDQANRSVEARKAEMAIAAVLKQDFVKTPLPTLTGLGTEPELVQAQDRFNLESHQTAPGPGVVPSPGTSTNLEGFFDTMLGNYLVDFDLDAPFCANNDMAAFGSLWHDFTNGTAEDNLAPMY
ncbi:fungal-specific transcription factor domain-containing protein [Leptodontidium sp. MPI-SDFR-AT-0119]|nr:fungal-specific transcription factor domain-containing protein [Leptodontidium sp. MPI-SDFR-AT-0119]